MDDSFTCGLRPRCVGWISIVALAIGSAAITNAQRQGTPNSSSRPRPILGLELGQRRQEFDLSDDRGLIRLQDASFTLLELSQRQLRERAIEQRRMSIEKPLAEMSRAELDSFYTQSDGLLTKRDRRGLEELQRLCVLAVKERDAAKKEAFVSVIAEVVAALNNNHRPPIPGAIDVAELPLVHYDYTHNPIAKGENLASNLEPRPTSAHVDSSKLNPNASTFWALPTNIAAL